MSMLALVCAAPAKATVQPRTALLEGGSLDEYDQVNQSTGTVALDSARAYQGRQSARATFNGGANGYERGLYHVDWKDGDDVWYGGAFYLPTGFKSKMQGQVDLMRWDNWGTFGDNDDRSGVVIHRNGMGNLMRMKFGIENVDIGPAFDIPEGRWFWLEVHQKLSKTDGQAYSEVFVDGRSVATTTIANTYGRGVDRVRYGLVAIDANNQKNPLTLWFDRTTVSTSQVGPLGAAGTAPAAATDPVSATSAPPAQSAPAAVATKHRLVDRARGHRTTASSRRGAAFPSRAGTDGSAHTRWISRPRPNQWWRVDLGHARKITEVKVTWGRGFAARYVIEASRDGRHWWNVAWQDNKGRGTVRTALRPTSARYVQVRSVRRGTHGGISLASARVLGPAM